MLKVETDGKSLAVLLQELSPEEFSGLLNYYKDDLAIGGYNPNVS